MALTTSAPTRRRSAKRNHHLGNPREISQSRRQRPRVRSCLAFTFRPPASGPRSGSAKVGADMLGSSGSNCTMRRRFIPRQGANGQRGASNVRVACSGDIDEVVRLMHDAAAWMSAKGTPARDVARIDRTFAETFVLRSGAPSRELQRRHRRLLHLVGRGSRVLARRPQGGGRISAQARGATDTCGPGCQLRALLQKS